MVTLPTPPSSRLDGRQALIIGASSGIGLGAATMLASAGAEVIMAARRESLLETLVQAFRDQGWSARHVRMNLEDIEATRHTMKALGACDIFVNCAGISRNGPALATTPEDFDAVLSTNFRGAYFATQTAAQLLQDSRKPGSLINISSQLAYVGGANRAVYSASKHALEGMTKSMAIEWGKFGIRINTISPTFIETARTADILCDPIQKKEVLSKIKLNRTGVIEDVMGAVLYLSSDLSTLVTGTTIMVDGGWTAE